MALEISKLGVNIPILHLGGLLYLIGCQRMVLELKRNTVMVRTGGGYQRFDEFIPNNHRTLQR